MAAKNKARAAFAKRGHAGGPKERVLRAAPPDLCPLAFEVRPPRTPAPKCPTRPRVFRMGLTAVRGS
jgi:hypothetical protein